MAARAFRPLAALAALAALSTILIGGYTSSTGSGLGCGDDWPHCNGTLTPDMTVFVTRVEWSHRLSAITLGAIGLATLGYTIRKRADLSRTAQNSVYLAAGLFASQALLGAAVVKTDLRAELVALHAGVAASLFTSLVVAYLSGPGGKAPSALGAGAGEAPQQPHLASRPVSRGLQDKLSPYVEMIKPGILFLLLIVGAAALIVAPGEVSFGVGLATLVGGGLAACSAAVLNNVIERDRDAQMARTKRRAVASGRVSPAKAYAFAGVLGVASMAILALFVNWLSAAFALFGLAFYVIVYTMWLKPTTPNNIVIGGAAGCAPAFVGWAAVTNDVSLAPVIIGLLVFLWTPPHFWALALVYKDDYAKASFPMHPSVKGEKSTRRQILAYSVVTVAASLALVWPLGTLGWVYALSALGLGGVFVYLSWVVLRTEAPKPAYRLFGYSIAYLGLLYGAMALDAMLGAPRVF